MRATMSLFFFDNHKSLKSNENQNYANDSKEANSATSITFSENSGESHNLRSGEKLNSHARLNPANNKTQHVVILAKDIYEWLKQRSCAVAVAIALIAVNFINWVVVTVLHFYKYGANATLSQFFARHKPTQGPTLFFGHGNIGTLLIKLCHTLFFVNSVPSLLVNVILAILLVGLAETKMGKLRMLLVSITSTLVGMLIGLMVIGNLSIIIRNMHWITRIPIRLSPFTLFIGAFMAAATYESILWHRRMLVLGYAITSAMLLYSGNPGDYCTIFAALTGHVIGNLMQKNKSANKSVNWWEGTDYEIRRLFSVTQLVMASGSIFALSSRSHAGILTTLGLFMSPQMGTKTWLARCMTNHSSASCLIHSGLQHVAIGGLWIRIMLPMLTLMLIAWGLLKGRRLAAWTAIIFNAITALYATMYFMFLPIIATKQSSIIHQRNAVAVAFMLTALPPLLIAILLAIHIRHFSNDTKIVSVGIGFAVIIITLCATGASYVFFGLMTPGSFLPSADLYHLLRDLPGRWMPMGFGNRSNAMLIPRTPLASFVTQSVGVVFWLVLFVVCFTWFRIKLVTNENDRIKASELVEIGGNTMSFMTTWPGNHYWFSHTGKSAIAYRLKYDIALTLTGPFGDEKEYKQDLNGFIQLCEKNSWSPVFYAVHEKQREALEELGFTSLKIGTDMLVYPNQWQTKGRKWQDIRTAINKAKRDGIIDVLSTYEEAPNEVQQQIVEISEEWAELKALPEMKFTLGGLDELHDNRVKILYAIDESGKVLGVTSWMPTYRNNKVIGWTLDFMRHRTDSPNGIMELLIARMAERLRDEGISNPDSAVEFMSLSAAPLAGIEEDELTSGSKKSTNIMNHTLAMMSDILEPAYGFKSLYFFKKKFQPEASPVYVCYLDSAKLAQISLAVTSSYLPEAKPKQLLEMVKSLRNKK